MRAGARVHLGSIEYRLHSRSRFLIALCVVWLRVCLVQSLVKEFVEFFARVAVRVILGTQPPRVGDPADCNMRSKSGARSQRFRTRVSAFLTLPL